MSDSWVADEARTETYLNSGYEDYDVDADEAGIYPFEEPEPIVVDAVPDDEFWEAVEAFA